jgi:hypothetical protein
LWGVYVMSDELNYDLLWQIVQKEKQTNELQLLPKGFYDEAAALLDSLSKKEATSEEVNLKKNAIRMVNDLYERRKQKILIYVAYKKQLPQPAVPTEQEFYNELSEVAKKNRVDTHFSKNGRHTMVSLQTIPEIILPSGKKAGPFEKGQVIEMNAEEEDIKFLINNTICKKA